MNNDVILETYMHNFTERLLSLRTKNNLTRAEMGKILDMTQTAYGYYETGTRKPPLDKVILIAQYFKISIDELMGYNALERYIDLCKEAGFTVFTNRDGSIVADENTPITYVGLDGKDGGYSAMVDEFIRLMDKAIEKYKENTKSELLYTIRDTIRTVQLSSINGKENLQTAVSVILINAKDGITTFDDVYSIAEKYKCSPTDIFKALPDNIYVTKARNASMGIKLPSQTAAPPGPPATKPKPKRTRKPKN